MGTDVLKAGVVDDQSGKLDETVRLVAPDEGLLVVRLVSIDEDVVRRLLFEGVVVCSCVLMVIELV